MLRFLGAGTDPQERTRLKKWRTADCHQRRVRFEHRARQSVDAHSRVKTKGQSTAQVGRSEWCIKQTGHHWLRIDDAEPL